MCPKLELCGAALEMRDWSEMRKRCGNSPLLPQTPQLLVSESACTANCLVGFVNERFV